MFPIYGTLIIVIMNIDHISYEEKQHGIRAGLGLTPSREGPGKWKIVMVSGVELNACIAVDSALQCTIAI
jgi:hypothetical protein